MAKIKAREPVQDEVIDQSVEQANVLIVGLFKATVDAYWQIGKLVKNIDTSYGKGGVKNFADKLAAKRGHHAEIGISTLYRCSQFYSKYSEDKKDRMIEAGISWSQVVETLPEDPIIVNEAVDRVIDKEVEASKLSDTVKTMRETDGNPSESKKAQEREAQAQVEAQLPEEDKLGIPKEFKREAVKIESTILTLLDQCGTMYLLIDKFKNMDAESQKTVKKELDSIRTALGNISKPLGTIYANLQELT